MRTLNDIVPPSRRREGEPLDASMGQGPLRLSHRTPRFPYATFVVVVLVIIVSVAVLFYFSTAKVEVTPKTVSAAIQNSFTGTQDGGALPYQIITVEKVATQSVAGSGSKTVTSSASGTLTIYNTQTQAQRLITNTRFVTTDGLIFRIRSAVTIPGGTPAKPGNIAVTAYADRPGSSYNIAPTSFTVPGFAGTPQASQVYGRSFALMAGGASGTVPVVESSLEAKTRATLMAALAPDLLKSIQEQVPAGYILLPGAATTTYQALAPASSSTTGTVDVKEQGIMTAVVFPSSALAKTMVSSIHDLDYAGEPLTLASSNGLMLTPTAGIPNQQGGSFPFTLSGTASFIYDVDSARIAAAVSGKTRSAAKVALTNYPEVKRAIVILRPFWRQTFPQDPSAIRVVVVGAGD